MKRTFFNSFLGILFLTIVSSSCSSNLDFNQVNDLQLEPAYIANLAHFDIPAKEFVAGGIEQSVVYAVPTVDVFNDAFFRDNLVRADFAFKINNTINRAYTLDITLLDANNVPLYVMHFDVPAYTGTENIVEKTEIFENIKLNLLKRTIKMAFVLNMKPGPLLDENSSGSLKLDSGVTAYFVVR